MPNSSTETVEAVLSTIGKALAHPARVELLRLLEDGERCGCEFVPLLGLDPSVISRHLAVLSRAGLVASRRDGVRILWRLARPDTPRLLSCLANLRCSRESG
ncbi:winged helix-turn-helix transcriptional regulator [Candidatus Bipolaricaulota bacterium]|nr:winged helix-turn-helix transcriptional regulator [Candidatus Bipolaricaulota bacterium]